MDSQNATLISIEKEGDYRLVPESIYKDLLNSYSLIGPSTFGKNATTTNLSLGLLIRIHCAKLGINICTLARRANIERAHLSKMSRDKLHDTPHKDTLKKLESALGPHFSFGLKLLGLVDGIADIR